MKALPKFKLLISVFGLLLFFTGCKQPETIVVEGKPTALAPSDTVTADTTTNEAGFRQLLIGEYQPINTLDPLYANNGASMRAVQLMYEGLVRLNEKGNVVPGLAENWKMSPDSTQYTFSLRSDIYYQDSDIFSTGTGRKLKAEDVKYVFERMAKVNVPPLAANLFMNIRGFNSFYQEQRLVYNPDERNLEGITGIQTPNAQTVVFQLERKDPQFLKKLATPLAVIYPQESVNNETNKFSPVGAGPFKFNRRTADSTLILSKFQNYYASSQIDLNRVDINIEPSEPRLFRTMSAGDIYLLPQLGPQLLKSILNSDGDLVSSYRETYSLNCTGGSSDYTMRHYTNSSLSEEGAYFIGNLLMADTTKFFQNFPARYKSTNSTNIPEINSRPASLNTIIYSAYYDDPFIRTFLGSVSTILSEYDTSLQMLNIRAPSRNTGLFFTKDFPLIPDLQWQNQPALFSFSVDHLALQRLEIENLNFNRYPWWFDLRNVTLPASENMK